MCGAKVKPLPEGVRRVAAALQAVGAGRDPVMLSDTARTAQQAAHAQPPVTLIDEELFRFDVIWAAAGHPHAVFRLTPHELRTWTGAPVADVTVR